MSENFYITTPIYYVNDVPHVGHAYTTIAADAFARYHRARGHRSYFLTGTDEHGQKIQDAAEARGLSPLELADSVVERFKETWQHLDISYDDFIRTTEDRHKVVVTEIWKRIEAAGDIYLGSYAGWYCVGCETFYPDNQLLEDGDAKNLCPVHKTPAKWLEEPSYFFRMSAYADKLLAHINKNPDFIRPRNYRNEVMSFVEGGLNDLSVSRTTFDWGIPVPTADGKKSDHIMYVWIDALSNYLSALGELGSEKSKAFFPEAIHLIGKDIIRFHAVYWPCMLMSAGLPLPKSILAHGWWTVRGEKIAKSMPATRVDPNQLAEDIGADALRYFLLREVPLGLDGDFSYESLIGRYNSELANDLGNLLGRATSMTAKYRDGAMPAFDAGLAGTGAHLELAGAAATAVKDAAAAFDEFAPSRALEAIWGLIRAGNRYVAACEPWVIAKDKARAAELDHVLRSALETLVFAARMVAPVMPAKAAELLSRLGLPADDPKAASWPAPDRFGHTLDNATGVETGGLFPRIDKPREAELLERWIPADAAAAPAKAAPPDAATGGVDKGSDSDGLVSFDDFKRFEFRAAKVLSAEPVPKTSKLLAVRLDVGPLGERDVIAGVAEAYDPADLVGQTVILLANLAPATIRGVRSEGMILAAGDKSILGLSTLDRDVPPGTIVR